MRSRLPILTATALLLFFLASCDEPEGSPSVAEADETAVIAVVQKFFDAMAAHDAEAFGATMMPEAVLHSAREGPERQPIRGVPEADTVEWLAGNREALLERTWNPEVCIRGRIALLWAPYDFWRNGRFSHCGVDIFTLVRADEGWRISSAVYTAESKGCAVSPLGPPDQAQLRTQRGAT